MAKFNGKFFTDKQRASADFAHWFTPKCNINGWYIKENGKNNDREQKREEKEPVKVKVRYFNSSEMTNAQGRMYQAYNDTFGGQAKLMSLNNAIFSQQVDEIEGLEDLDGKKITSAKELLFNCSVGSDSGINDLVACVINHLFTSEELTRKEIKN